MSDFDGPRTAVNHLVFEVPQGKLVDEIAFWRALGFGRRTRPEPKWKGEWLNGFGLWARLIPVEPRDDCEARAVKLTQLQVAIVPRDGLDVVLGSLERAPMLTHAVELEPYWGARRVYVVSPSGFRIELLDSAPPAAWPGPPEL